MLLNITRQLALCGSFFTAIALTCSADAKPSMGDGSVLAPIAQQAHYCAGQPGCNGGFPEGVAIVRDRVYVGGPATFGEAGKGPSVVTVLDRETGDLLAEIPLQGEKTEFEHALSGLTVDSDGDVYALTTQLGVVRIERHGDEYTQSSYSPPLPDIPACTPGGPTPCSPTPIDLPPIPNEMIFDDDGNLYITDSLQATIFRVPRGGGSIEIWLQSPLFAGNLAAPLPFGTNGIKISPDRDYLYVNETFDPTDMTLGHVYRVPIEPHPDADDIELFATFTNEAAPDSLVFGKSGRLYVSLAKSGQIAVLDTDGSEITRISGPSGSAIPLDWPATMAFDDEHQSLLVANHAIFGNHADFAVLRVFVGEKGDPYPEAHVDDGHRRCD